MKIKKGWFSVACWFLFTFCVLKKQTNKNTSVIELAKKQCSRFHSTLHEAAFWPSRSKIFELLTNTEMRGKMKWSVLVQLSVNVTFWKFELKYHCSWAKRQQLLVFDGKRLKWVSKLFFSSTDSKYALPTCRWRLEINNNYKVQHRPWIASEMILRQGEKWERSRAPCVNSQDFERGKLSRLDQFHVDCGGVHWDHSGRVREVFLFTRSLEICFKIKEQESMRGSIWSTCNLKYS